MKMFSLLRIIFRNYTYTYKSHLADWSKIATFLVLIGPQLFYRVSIGRLRNETDVERNNTLQCEPNEWSTIASISRNQRETRERERERERDTLL